MYPSHGSPGVFALVAVLIADIVWSSSSLEDWIPAVNVGMPSRAVRGMMCVLNRGVATTGQLGGPRAEATGPISTSNSVEEQSREHHQESRNTLGPTNAGEPGPMQDKEGQASELHLVLYM